MLSKMHGGTIVRLCGASLLICVAPAIAVCGRWVLSKPEASVAVMPAEVRVKAVEHKPETVERENVTASGVIAIVCGEDAATAGRYEARNDALRSIVRRRDLPEKENEGS